jgi:uncharacterized membrane protein
VIANKLFLIHFPAALIGVVLAQLIFFIVVPGWTWRQALVGSVLGILIALPLAMWLEKRRLCR